MDMTMFRHRGLLLNTPHIVNESGSIVTFNSAYNKIPIKSVICNIDPIQEGSGDPSPDNVRPISGRTGLRLELGSTATDYEPYKGNTYSVNWETEAGTVYGGCVDVVSGKLVVGRAVVTMNGSQPIGESQNKRFYAFIASAFEVNASNQNTYKGVICDKFPSYSWGGLAGAPIGCAPVWGQGIGFKHPGMTATDDWKTYFTNNPTVFSYELATPTEIQLTPQEVRTLLGTNNIWCDSGNVSVNYWKWGK